MKSSFAFVLLFAAAAACNSDPSAVIACRDVPDGGCPSDHGATVCDDPTCNAVYACVNGSWVFDKTCPPHPHDASVDALADATSDATVDSTSSIPDVSIDVPPGAYGGPGCSDLQTPDCSLGAALACATVPGCCDCQNLYVCANGGWNAWGTCGDAGIVPGP